jgi:toxin ParE1/3/4
LLQLSKQALADLKEIRSYTVETWGRAQWLTYYRQPVTIFERIAEMPDAGKERSLFVKGMHSVNCERHVIFYKKLAVADGCTGRPAHRPSKPVHARFGLFWRPRFGLI